jgi:hypothetical protein
MSVHELTKWLVNVCESIACTPDPRDEVDQIKNLGSRELHT